MIKGFGYAVKQSIGKTKQEYKTAFKAVYEHRFDNHDYCNSWCKYKIMGEE